MILPIAFAAAALQSPSAVCPPPARPAVRASVPNGGAAHIPAGDLYSARARRRMASLLRMRLLELRQAGLEQAAQAIERRLNEGSTAREPLAP